MGKRHTKTQIWYITKKKLKWNLKKKYCESLPVHASDDTSNDTLRDSPLLDLQTPDPYTHQTITPPMTPSVTALS